MFLLTVWHTDSFYCCIIIIIIIIINDTFYSALSKSSKALNSVGNRSMPTQDKQRRKLDAKAHKAIFVGYPPGVKGYQLYDPEKNQLVVSRDVQFFEDNFDHFKEGSPVDLKSIFPDMNESSESVPEHPLNEEPAVPEQYEPPDQRKEEPVAPESNKPSA